jgi:hypothetical protein
VKHPIPAALERKKIRVREKPKDWMLSAKYREAATHNDTHDFRRDAEDAKASEIYRRGRILVPFYSEYDAPHYGASNCFRYHKKGEHHK